MSDLTEAQRSVLTWLPADGSAVHWAGKIFKHPPKASVSACLRRGWAKRVGHLGMDLYAITPAGRTALSASQGGEKP